MLKIHNKTLVISVIVLTLFGLVMIYSASNYTAKNDYNDSFFFVKKQLIAFFISIFALIIGKNINIETLKKYNMLLYIFSIILLTLVFIPKIGVESYGAKRWINLGFTTFQPSEIAKFSLMISLACTIEKKSVFDLKQLIKCCMLVGIIALLIMLEPNMSITMCVVMAAFIVFIVGGLSIKQFIVLFIPMLLLVILLIVIEPYRVKRLLAFIDPWANPLGEGYQLIQSYYALSNGKFFGVGLFNSVQKYMFLTFAESDFIFSIIGEELGFIGSTFVVFMFLLVIISGYKIAIKSNTRFNTLLATSITSIILVQVALNISVVSGLIPPTGLPLPFISLGGTSLVVFYFFIGVLDNISNSLDKSLIHKMY